MRQERWFFRDVPAGSTFHARVTPTGAVGSGGDWFQPDPEDPARNAQNPAKAWTHAQLRAGVEEPLDTDGRYKGDIIVRPAGGSVDIEMWIEQPAGTRIKERSSLGLKKDTNFLAFIYVV